MATILVHIHTGPENPTKAALGLLIALTSLREGHDVSLFLAGDAVHLLAPDHQDLEGVGTGCVGDHLQGLAEADVPMRVSGMSAKARGYDDSLLDGQNASFSMPDGLVAMATGADTVLCY